jgi:hypothetical protein
MHTLILSNSLQLGEEVLSEWMKLNLFYNSDALWKVSEQAVQRF